MLCLATVSGIGKKFQCFHLVDASSLDPLEKGGQ